MFLDTVEPYPDPVLTAASVAAAGWPVIRLWPGSKKPIGSGGAKHQGIWLTTADAVFDAATDFYDDDTQCRWPSWGVILGEPNSAGWRLTVLDTDSDEAEARLVKTLPEIAGAEAWAAHTATIRTARGVHRYALTTAEVGTCKPWAEFDLKDSGYVLLPGSKHPSGKRYHDFSPPGARVITDAHQPPASIYRPRPDDGDDSRYGWSLILPAPAALMELLTLEARQAAAGLTGVSTEEARALLGQFDGTASETREVPASRPDTAPTDGSAYERVIAALRAADRRVDLKGAGQAMASCPGPMHTNGDRNPSLSITGIEGRVLVHCFSGCGTDTVLHGVGLSLTDLFDSPDPAPAEENCINCDEAVDPDTGEIVQVVAEPRKKRRRNRDDLDNMAPPDEVIGGLLPARGTLAMLAGSRGLGKSLLTLDIAAHVADPTRDYFHSTKHPVRHHGPVLYVSLEGFQGVPKRVRAWETERGGRIDGVEWYSDPVDLKRPESIAAITEEAEEMGALLIMVDSAAQSGVGKEDTEDTGRYVDGLNLLRRATGALVLVLHNTGWDGSRERGSTRLPDACDTTLLLEGDPKGMRTLTHRKHRDGDMLEVGLDFTFKKIDGTESGVLVHTPRGPLQVDVNGAAPMAKVSKKQTEAQEIRDGAATIYDVMVALQRSGVGDDGWVKRSQIRDAGGYDGSHYLDAMAELIAAGTIERKGTANGTKYRLL